MAHLPSDDPLAVEPDRRALLDVARASIDHGLAHGTPVPVDPSRFSPPLNRSRAVFVTLRIDRKLRGCIGSLDPIRTLVEDTAEHAYRAALHDPRFGPVSADEAAGLEIELSILTEPSPLIVTGEQDLLNQLRPGVDGLILDTGGRRATFLPAVWKSVGDARRFVSQLKLKAGLEPDQWPADIGFRRYEAETVA